MGILAIAGVANAETVAPQRYEQTVDNFFSLAASGDVDEMLTLLPSFIVKNNDRQALLQNLNSLSQEFATYSKIGSESYAEQRDDAVHGKVVTLYTYFEFEGGDYLAMTLSLINEDGEVRLWTFGWNNCVMGKHSGCSDEKASKAEYSAEPLGNLAAIWGCWKRINFLPMVMRQMNEFKLYQGEHQYFCFLEDGTMGQAIYGSINEGVTDDDIVKRMLENKESPFRYSLPEIGMIHEVNTDNGRSMDWRVSVIENDVVISGKTIRGHSLIMSLEDKYYRFLEKVSSEYDFSVWTNDPSYEIERGIQ